MDVQKCIKTIQGKPGGLFGFGVSYTEKVKCIAELAKYDDPYLDAVILSATRDENHSVQEMASSVIVTRFHECADVKEVEERMSDLLLRTTDPSFWHSTRKDDDAVALVSIASVNRIGYVRQAALEQMAITADRRYIPFILRRSGDWVPQLRERAKATIVRYSTPELRAGFLSAISDIGALLRVKRIDLRPVYEEVMRWLVSEVEPTHLLNDVKGLTDPSRARFVRHLLVERTCDEAMLAALIVDRSFLIRHMVVRHLCARPEPWSSVLLEKTLVDPFPRIRTGSLKELIQRDAVNRTMLINGLTDASFDVRELAAKRLGWSREAFVRHYRERLNAGERIVGALLGLADMNDTDVTAAIVPCTEHADLAVRRAALMALVKLAPEVAYSRAMEMIVDRNKPIRAKAENILLARHDQGVIERAVELMSSGKVMHRMVGLSLLNKYGGWKTLAPMLDACIDGSSEVADQAWVDLGAWVAYARRLFTVAVAEDIEQARKALARVRERVDAPSYAQGRVLSELRVLLG